VESWAYEFFDKRDERVEVLLDGEVELVAVLEVHRDCRASVEFSFQCPRSTS
jgi:hypothetical protein